MINGKLISHFSEYSERYHLNAQDIHYDPQSGKMVGYGLYTLMYWLAEISIQSIATTIDMINEICKHDDPVYHLYIDEFIYVSYAHRYIYIERILYLMMKIFKLL